jgi:hypothetical protein
MTMNKRYSSRMPVECSVTLVADGFVGEGRVLNLSVPGCLIETSTRLEVGQYLRVHLQFQNDQIPLRIALAAVRRVEGAKVGLELIRMSHEDRLRLRHIVGYHEPRKPSNPSWSEAVVLSGGESW